MYVSALAAKRGNGAQGDAISSRLGLNSVVVARLVAGLRLKEIVTHGREASAFCFFDIYFFLFLFCRVLLLLLAVIALWLEHVLLGNFYSALPVWYGGSGSL